MESVKPILHVDPKRGLLEHVLALLGEIDNRPDTTFEEAETIFRSFNFEIREEDWDFFVNQFSREDADGVNLPELEKSIFSVAQDYLKKLGIVDFKGHFLEEGFQSLEKQVTRLKGSALEPVAGNLGSLVQLHEWRLAMTQFNFLEAQIGCAIPSELNEIDEEGDFVVWLLKHPPLDKRLCEIKNSTTLRELRMDLFPRKVFEPNHRQVVPTKQTPASPPIDPSWELRFEPIAFEMDSPIKGIIKSIATLDSGLIPESALNQNFGISWSGDFYPARLLDWNLLHNFFVEGTLSMGGRFYTEGLATNNSRSNFAMELLGGVGLGYTIWEEAPTNEIFSYLSRFDEKLFFYGAINYSNEGRFGAPLLSLEARLIKLGPLTLIGGFEQSLAEPRAGFELKLQFIPQQK